MRSPSIETPWNRQRLWLPALLALATVTAPAAAKIDDPAPNLEALEQAFRFASAITPDPRDMAMAQESVVLEYMEADALEEAVRKAEAIDGWRRGVALADVAARLALAGRADEARALVRRADDSRRTIDGWQERRIAAHVGQTLALLGDIERADTLARELATHDRQYIGRSVAMVAAGLAAKGRPDEAFSRLSTLDGIEDFDVSWWRTVGYIEIARQHELSRDLRLAALEKAVEAARTVPGWKAAEALVQIAGELGQLGQGNRARALLEEAEPTITALAESVTVRAPLTARLAESWSRVGEVERARKLLGEAERAVPETMVIDRPAAYAELAVAERVAGDPASAERLFDRALSEAEALVNARPRALAVVAVLRSMARAGRPLDPDTRARLDRLHRGLGDPW